MQPISRREILDLAEYEAIREQFLSRVIQEKKRRRIAIGPHVTAVFENRDTVLLQIQEMLRTERITRESSVQHEMDTYNALLPGSSELSLTLMIEIDSREEREQFLSRAIGFESSIALLVSGEIFHFTSDTRPDADVRTTAVHYLKVKLSAQASLALRDKRAENVTIAIRHALYSHEQLLSPSLLHELAEDLREP